MKIREGFVSNSSSTSFCIYGIIVSEEENLPSGSMLDYYYGDPDSYDRNIYLGSELADCPNDMTMGDYKNKIKEQILEAFPDANIGSLGIYEESYYNG